MLLSNGLLVLGYISKLLVHLIDLLTLWPRLLRLWLLLYHLLLGFVSLLSCDICILNHHITTYLFLLFYLLLLMHFNWSLFPSDQVSSILLWGWLSWGVWAICSYELILVNEECLIWWRFSTWRLLTLGTFLIIIMIVIV